MTSNTWHAFTRTIAVAAAATLFAACAADAPVAPRTPDAPAATRVADFGTCEHLRAPAGTKLGARLFATGVQIYRWNGASWSFVAPEADLFPNPQANGRVGTHFAGPTWLSVSGGQVVGTVIDRCTPDPDAIPWLSLGAVATGPGIFHGTTFIQRMRTTGGKAPAAPGTLVGQEVRVPYTAQYLFYRPR